MKKYVEIEFLIFFLEIYSVCYYIEDLEKNSIKEIYLIWISKQFLN